MIHRLENGDNLKLLPFITQDNQVKWGYQYRCFVTKKRKSIYDVNEYLSRAYFKHRNELKNLRLTTRYAFNVYIDDQIKVINVSKKLMDIITESNKNALNLKSNNHLIIIKEDVSTTMGNYYSKTIPLANYDKSYIGESKWNYPIDDINSKSDWLNYIKGNQPKFIEYVEENSAVKKRKELIEEFGFDIISEYMSEDREKKLQEILN